MVAIDAFPPNKVPIGNKKALHFDSTLFLQRGGCKDIYRLQKKAFPTESQFSITLIPRMFILPFLSFQSHAMKAWHLPWRHGGSFRSSWFSLFRRGTKIAEEGEANSSDMGSRWIEGQQWSP